MESTTVADNGEYLARWQKIRDLLSEDERDALRDATSALAVWHDDHEICEDLCDECDDCLSRAGMLFGLFHHLSTRDELDALKAERPKLYLAYSKTRKDQDP